MAETVKKKGFLMACKVYFGYRRKQTLKGFAEEMGKVDYTFRQEIFEFFKANHIDCAAPLMK